MPTKHVFAFAIEDAEGRILLGRRNARQAEYPCAWSLPSRRVSREQFEDEAGLAEVARTTIESLAQVEEIRSLERVAKAARTRSGYEIEMALFHVRASGEVRVRVEKYRDTCWARDADIAELFPEGGGLCVMMLVRHLIEQGRLDVAVNYVEVPPELFGKPPALWANAEIWRETAHRQYVDMRGESGVAGGFFVKEHSVDRYVAHRAAALLVETGGRLLDIGCGDGRLVGALRAQEFEALGCDIGIDEAGSPSWLFTADIESGVGLGGRRFDIILLNLVLPWLADVDAALTNVIAACDPGARVIATMAAPEFTKNGRFLQSEGDFSWLIEEPVRREPFPTMINHEVGPLLYYPRTVPDYLNAFIRAGLLLRDSRYLFLDSELEERELEAALARWPDLRRHIKFPSFLAFELEKSD